MDWLKIFKRGKDFTEMSKNEKGEFLSNDFIDRMIRVEQNVATSFGERKHYPQTKYYKSLTSSEKERFNQYLKKKQSFLRRLAFVFSQKTTGAVIGTSAGGFSFLSVAFLALFFMIVLTGVFFLLRSKRKDKKFRMYFDVLNDIHLKRRAAEIDI